MIKIRFFNASHLESSQRKTKDTYPTLDSLDQSSRKFSGYECFRNREDEKKDNDNLHRSEVLESGSIYRTISERSGGWVAHPPSSHPDDNTIEPIISSLA